MSSSWPPSACSPGAPRTQRGEGGFTLAEVMVVVLVIGILVAIGIPTYLGARTRGQDKAAQSSLRSGLAAATVALTDRGGDFTDADASDLAVIEPAIAFIASPTASTGPGEVSVAVNPQATAWAAAARSDSGVCYHIRADRAGATTFGASDSGPCDGAAALSAAGPDWNNTDGGIGGGFTSDLGIGGYWNTHAAGQFVGDEWEVLGGSVDGNITHSSAFTFGVDGQFIDLNGASAGHIRRSVNVIPNTPYELTVDLGENSYGGPAVKQMEVIWNGAVIDTVDVDVARNTLVEYTVPIPPSANGQGVLEFRSLHGGAYGPVLGNVELTPA